MREITWRGNHLEMYDSLQEAPVTRLQAYNLNVLLDAGIGSDLDGFDSRVNNIRILMTKNTEAADKELTNLQMNVRFLMSKTTPEMNSFVVLIKRMNGRDITEEDLTEEGIRKIIEELGKRGLTVAKLRGFLDHVKKKFEVEYESFFQDAPGGSELKEFYTLLQERWILECQEIINPNEETERRIEEIEEEFTSRIQPKTYHGSRGMEVRMINRFEDLCILLAQHHVAPEPRIMKALAFYRAAKLVEDQNKAAARRNQKVKH